ncbi:MAG: DUF4221 domain-containing protein [Bernardetiaceae bacterium]|nr:DUF4221 domain-containing protein [Bernardetiaceae bacterium]
MSRPFAHFLPALCLAALAWACQPTSQETANREFTIELGPPRRFQLDSVTGILKAHLSYFAHQGRGYLLLLNHKDTSFYLYDWANGQLLRRTKLAAEGPQGVGRSLAAIAQSPDSVFLIAPQNNWVSLVNGAGQLLRKYPGPDQAGQNGPLWRVVTNYKQLPIKIGQHLYLPGRLMTLVEDTSFFHQAKVLMDLDLVSGQISQAVPYPDLYHQPGQHYPGQWVDQGHASNGKSLVFSFSVDPQVYEYALPPQDPPQAHLAASQHFAQVPHHPKPLEGRQEMEVVANSPFFEGIFYLPGQQQYYRLAYLPDPKTPFSPNELVLRLLKPVEKKK